jgi:hypothetical protein
MSRGCLRKGYAVVCGISVLRVMYSDLNNYIVISMFCDRQNVSKLSIFDDNQAILHKSICNCY